MQKTSISPIDVCVTNYKSRKSREKVDPSISELLQTFRIYFCKNKRYFKLLHQIHSTHIFINIIRDGKSWRFGWSTRRQQF